MASMPLRISSELIARARAEAELSDRSVTAQVEHWVKLGMALEDALSHKQIRELKRSWTPSVEDALALARTAEGQELAREHLNATGQPRYGTDPAFPGKIVRIAPDGTKTPGKFVSRLFVPDER